LIPSVKILNQITPSILNAAQAIYNNWEQDENGFDEEYGGGGICHDIADSIVDVLSQHNIEATSVSQSIGEVHVYVVAKFQEGIYEIDIPPSIYEKGYAYTWKKIPNVKFNKNHLIVNLIDKNTNKFEDFLENNNQNFKMWIQKFPKNFILRRKWPTI
jgi:hypothetical protein